MKNQTALEKAAEAHWRKTRDKPKMYPTDDFEAGAKWLARRLKAKAKHDGWDTCGWLSHVKTLIDGVIK